MRLAKMSLSLNDQTVLRNSSSKLADMKLQLLPQLVDRDHRMNRKYLNLTIANDGKAASIDLRDGVLNKTIDQQDLSSYKD